MSTSTSIILYHAKCRDGFSAAWAAWKKFGNKAEYIGLEHHLPLPEGFKGKTIYFLDYAPSEAEMTQLLAENERVIILDHHVSQEKEIKMASEFVYDNNHSGAVLAWNYFHSGKKTPRFLLHVEDADIWKFKVPGTREILLATENALQDFKTWDRLVREMEDGVKRKKYIEHGKAIREYERALIERIMEDAELVTFEGHNALAANTPVIISETGNAMVREMKVPVAILWRKQGDKIVVSLRSDGKVDVSQIAKKYGGGGHKSAAGFSFSFGQAFPWK